MVTIQEITEKKDIKKFIAFANDMYRDNPYYVPDTFDSQVADFIRDKNPAYEYCDSKCFLAYRDGKIVGRIAAIYNEHANQKYDRKEMRFSHADYIDDDEVVDALFAAVEKWAKELDCVLVHGPFGFTDMDREGLLIQGYDRLSQFFVYYNHPYYKTQMERMGYEKDVDWIEYLIKLPEQPDERLERLATMVQRRLKLHPAELKKKAVIKKYIERVFKLYNEAYSVLYGMVALTQAQIEKYVGEFFPLVNENTTCIVLDENDDVVAFGVSSPSISRAQQKCRGRMWPFGWIGLLQALKGKNDTLDLLLIAVKPELQGKGVNAIVMNQLLKNAIKKGIRYAETGPELEMNDKVQSQWKTFETEQHKRRRSFVKYL
ncbi:MAG: hypothetical protein PHO41_00665 [Eubacteriales bacterium]|nr:hypothetical protein [Eubacteriales bacterium]